MDNLVKTYGQLGQNIWTTWSKHMDNLVKTYGQLCQNIWTTLSKHMDNTLILYKGHENTALGRI